ncbi:unnamed protein product [Anisakis simplex]|uniref:non-specific serine/threonine protein kinase n=1 Tax=Anisakis simplex TaxID=6269 RepID=A0A0M3J8H5_ANISI|nr:unnamed protein product [Anisakis simplex]
MELVGTRTIEKGIEEVIVLVVFNWNIFSRLSTSIKLGIETVEAIGHLHDIGYIHRDVKPQNFTIGNGEKADNIYLLDFGIARRYIEKFTKAIRIPRRQVKFIGTIRFASRSCHLGKEQCRRDDLEAWVYMLIEFTQYAILPWSRTINRETVLREKQRLFNGKCSSLHRRFH